ncbi:MAG: hypothetical protein KGV59_02295 [Tenacibaculum sp.]|nr:hypothetical protein [Tenacibaculum sp.]
MNIFKNITKKQAKIFLSGLGLVIIGLMFLYISVKIFRENYNRKLTDANHYGYKIHQTKGQLKNVKIVSKRRIMSTTRTSFGNVLTIKLYNQPNIFVLFKGIINNYTEIEKQLIEYNPILHIYYTKNNLLHKGYVEIVQLEANNNIIYSYKEYRKNEFFGFSILLFLGIIFLIFGGALLFIIRDRE